jgi:large subunit ribosomal protein L23
MALRRNVIRHTFSLCKPLLKVLRAPHVSEKASTAMEKTNTIVLKVAKDATKAEIKAAVQKQ